MVIFLCLAAVVLLSECASSVGWTASRSFRNGIAFETGGGKKPLEVMLLE